MNLCVPIKTDIIPEAESLAILDPSAGISESVHHYASMVPSYHRRVRADLYRCANARMNRLKPPFLVNEKDIETLLEMIDGQDTDGTMIYWLLVARLTELGLLCAGHYADNCEFAAAGDLLVNPRKVEIHVRGIDGPLVKRRHGRLSDQLRQCPQLSSKDTLEIKREAHPVIMKPAILPHLQEVMRQSGRFHCAYLSHIAARMQQIADTIGFLAAGSYRCAEDLYPNGEPGAGARNTFLEEHLCRFDPFLYHRLGQHIDALLSKEDHYVV